MRHINGHIPASRRRLRAFTLFEMMIVMALMATVAGALTLGVGRLLADQRFRAGVGEVHDLVGLAQEVMLIYGAEVQCELAVTKNGLTVTLRSDKELPPLVGDYFGKEHVVEGIMGVVWDDATGVRTEGGAKLQFWSPGTVMSRGILFLSKDRRIDIQGTAWRSLALAGYPAPIVIGQWRTMDHLPRRPHDDAEELYPYEIVEEKA